MFNYPQGGAATLEPPTVGLNGQARITDFAGIPTPQSYIGGVPMTGIPMSQTITPPFTHLTPQIPAYPTVQPGINTVPVAQPMTPFTSIPNIGLGGVPMTTAVNPVFNPLAATTVSPFGVPVPQVQTCNPMLPWVNQAPVQHPFFPNTVPHVGVNGVPTVPFVNPIAHPLAAATTVPWGGIGGYHQPVVPTLTPFGITPTVNPLVPGIQPFGTPITPFGAPITPFGTVPTPFVNNPLANVTNPWVRSAMGAVVPNTITGLANPFCPSPTLVNPNLTGTLPTTPWGHPCFGTLPYTQVPGALFPTPTLGHYGGTGIPGFGGVNPFVNTNICGPYGAQAPYNPLFMQQLCGPGGQSLINTWACGPLGCNVPGFGGIGSAGLGCGTLTSNPYTMLNPQTCGIPFNTAPFCPIC